MRAYNLCNIPKTKKKIETKIIKTKITLKTKALLDKKIKKSRNPPLKQFFFNIFFHRFTILLNSII